MNKAKLVSIHAQDLKIQVGLGLSIDECEDIIARAIDGYESLVKESDSLPCVRECLIQVNETLERHGKIDANTELHERIKNTL